jgi:transposase
MEVKLPDTIEECHSLIGNLFTIIQQMQADIDELKAKLNQNSRNSNRPPSSDHFANRKSALPKRKGKRGGQQGHSGNTLKKVNHPDLVIDCLPTDCSCGNSTWLSQHYLADSRQVFDLPEPRLHITEYRRLQRLCQCGKWLCGEFPQGVVAPTQWRSCQMLWK